MFRAFQLNLRIEGAILEKKISNDQPFGYIWHANMQALFFRPHDPGMYIQGGSSWVCALSICVKNQKLYINKSKINFYSFING